MELAEVADVLRTLARLCDSVPVTPVPEPPSGTYPSAFLNVMNQLLGPGDEPGGDEGGYSNDPDDPGGETNFGLDKRSNPDLDIRNLTKGQAIDVYYTSWWLRYKISQLPPTIGAKMFNAGVNMGWSQVTKFLQRAVGVNADGIIGPITLAAVSAADVDSVLQSIRNQQREFYLNLVARRPSSKKFLDGWLCRAAE